MQASVKSEAKVKDLPASELWKLIDHLKTLLSKDEKKSELYSIEKRLTSFFPNMSMKEELEFDRLVEDHNDSEYADFVAKYPDQVVDLSGTSKSKEPEMWEAEMMVVNGNYQLAENTMKTGKAKSKEKQILRAFTLQPLNAVKSINYSLTLPLLQKEYPDNFFFSGMDNYVKECKKLFGNTILIDKLLEYCQNIEYYEHFRYFLGNVLARLDCAFNDKDHKYKETDEFLQNVEKLEQSIE